MPPTHLPRKVYFWAFSQLDRWWWLDLALWGEYLLFATFVQKFCSHPSFTTFGHKFCSQLFLTDCVQNFCWQLVFTVLIHNFCSQLLFTTIVHNYCSQLLFTFFHQLVLRLHVILNRYWEWVNSWRRENSSSLLMWIPPVEILKVGMYSPPVLWNLEWEPWASRMCLPSVSCTTQLCSQTLAGVDLRASDVMCVVCSARIGLGYRITRYYTNCIIVYNCPFGQL